jgi:hypothetical protein
MIEIPGLKIGGFAGGGHGIDAIITHVSSATFPAVGWIGLGASHDRVFQILYAQI